MLPRGIVKCVDSGYDATVPLDLGDLEMQIAERRNLGQMGDDDHLVILRERPECLANDLTGSSADTDVDLVEDHGRSLVGFGEDRLQSQHEPRRLPTGGNLAERFQ